MRTLAREAVFKYIYSRLFNPDDEGLFDVLIKGFDEDDKNFATSLKNFVLEKGTNLKFGARPLRRAIQRHIEDEIAEKVLRGEIKEGQNIVVSLENDNLKWSI